MTNRRQKSPGSFQDELGGVIERMGPPDRKVPPNPNKTKRPEESSAELNDRLFWRRPDEKG